MNIMQTAVAKWTRHASQRIYEDGIMGHSLFNITHSVAHLLLTSFLLPLPPMNGHKVWSSPWLAYALALVCINCLVTSVYSILMIMDFIICSSYKNARNYLHFSHFSVNLAFFLSNPTIRSMKWKRSWWFWSVFKGSSSKSDFTGIRWQMKHHRALVI